MTSALLRFSGHRPSVIRPVVLKSHQTALKALPLSPSQPFNFLFKISLPHDPERTRNMDYEPLTKSSQEDDDSNNYEEVTTSRGNELTVLWVGLLSTVRRLPRHRQKRLAVKLVLITLLLTSTVFLLALLIILGITNYREAHTLNFRLRQVSSYSPVHDLLDLNLQTKQTNGTFFPSKRTPSIARLLPNPQSDALWQEYDTVRPIPLTKSDLLLMGKDPSTAVRLSPADFPSLKSDDAYPGSLDVMHHLHCLNSLRKIIYSSYYNESTVNPHKVTMKSMHVNHCIDLIMQALQCSGNVNFITWHWVKDQPYPFPDMSTNRKCIDFERLVDWQRENSLDRERYDAVTRHKPKGVKERPAPDALYEWHGVPSPNHINGANEGEDFNF